MKKEKSERTKIQDDEMRPEYDFSSMKGGVRGKHYKALREGYTVKVHEADGTTEVRHVPPQNGAIVLDPDVAEYFPDSESVNETLRMLIMIASRNPKRPTPEKIRKSGKQKYGP